MTKRLKLRHTDYRAKLWPMYKHIMALMYLSYPKTQIASKKVCKLKTLIELISYIHDWKFKKLVN